MKKRLFIIATFLMGWIATYSQVTGTITDSDGTAWAGGSYNVSFIPTPSVPNISGSGVFAGLLDGSGAFSLGLQANGSTWLFSFCSVTSSANPCFQKQIIILNASGDVTAQLGVPPGPRFSAGSNAFGYADIEASHSGPGACYWNVSASSSSQPIRCWTGTAWVAQGGGGGGGVASLNSLIGAVTLAAGTNVTLTPSGNTITIASSGGGGSGITTLTPSVYGTASGTTGTLKTQRGVNAVVDWGLDNTGGSDVGATINTKCAAYSTSNTQPEVFFPAGTYLVTTPIACTGSSTTVNNLSFIGEGRAARNGAGTVTFNCNTANSTCMWFDNSTASTGNDKGPRLEHLTLIDTSSSKNDFALLRITQYNSIYVNDVSTQASVGTQYATGTVSISNGSTALTGAGTTFPAGIQFGHLQIGGNFQEVASQSSGTAATLTSNWQYTTAAGSAYAINYGGIGFLIEGTSATGFTQYGTVVNYSGTGNRVCLDFGGGPTSSSGTSRIHFYGGYCNGARVADSIGVFAGKFSDTHKIDFAVNNVARGFISESAHALVFAGELENTGAFTVVSTCNSGVAAQSCTKGVVLNADATTTGHDTRILGGYIYTWGTGISVDSANVSTGQIDSVAMRGNTTTNYSWSDASTGCSGTQTNAIVVQPDCDFFPSVLANNVATAGTTQGLAGLGVGTGTITLPGTFPTNYVGLIGPPSGTPAYFLQLPSASPSGGQVQTCATPSTVNGVNQSVCTWTAAGTGLSGMTATQVPIAATASTVTSSKALAGSGAGITTGPTTSTNTDCANFSGTTGQIADSGAPCATAALSAVYTSIPVGATNSTAIGAVTTNNSRLAAFFVSPGQAAAAADDIAIDIVAIDNTTNAYDIGIYGPGCMNAATSIPRVWHIGAATPGSTFGASASVFTISLSSTLTTLATGWYCLALTSSATTPLLTLGGVASSNASPFTVGVAGPTTTGATLPTTITAPTLNWVKSSIVPYVNLY